MRFRWIAGVSMMMCGCLVAARAEDIRWRPANPAPTQPQPAVAVAPTVDLGQPVWVGVGSNVSSSQTRNSDGLPVLAVPTSPPVVATVTPLASSRSQPGSNGMIAVQYSDGTPPPPAPPGGSTIAPVPPMPPPPPPSYGPDYGYAGGPPPSSGGGGFFKNIEWGTCSGGGRTLFQSDHGFDSLISPVSSPFLNEDPRSLTEVRPIFIWQKTPNSNGVFNGGSNYFFGTQARLAVTERIDVVMNEIGGVWQNPKNPTPYFQVGSGVSELRIGPKFTFLRDECSRTVAAAGVTFDIPSGSRRVEQNTGALSVAPYFTIGHSFAGSSFGNFNAQGTVGYDFTVDNRRSSFFYLNAHVDYDIAGMHKIYPLIELNWLHYGSSGNNANVNGFEGGDLFNFGSQGVAGSNDITMALGARYKFCEAVQLGGAIEFPLAGPKDLDGFRITADLILRY
jgi:hypothetical protein